MHQVVIPAVGESITEGIISRWLVADGAIVAESTPLFELETDKISTEVQAGANGQVRFQVAAGDTVPVGGVVALIDPAGTAAAAAAPDAGSGTTSAAKPAEPGSAKLGKPADAKPAADAPPPSPLSPAVKKLVADAKIDPAAISGTGKDGRLTKGDVLAAIAAPTPDTIATGKPSTRVYTPNDTPADAKPAPAVEARGPATISAMNAPTVSDPGVTRKRMTPLRQRIAQRLVQAQHTAAILTTFNEIDMSAAMGLRKRFKEEFEKKHGIGLGFMSIFSAAAIAALKKYPLINSQIEGADIVTPSGVHLGVAVGTEKGLVVPVLRHADRMGFADIEKAIKAAAVKAREGKLAIEDLQGGTFTITNGGVYGSLMSTPIINPPQSGILGMHAIKDRPMAIDGQVVIRPMMYVALSYDHRIVDGSEAVGFLVRIKELVENPEKMLLGL
jgi:2-oxoglutarate dehydrogenase E2 component (dihydrolipoamide succinyltransferase)